MNRGDADRLAALRRYEILDSEPEEQFDDIVRLAASLCDTPMAAVSLVDDERQWFKSRVGLPMIETPRSDAFCAHAIDQRDVLEVEDAAVDPRFAENPLVLGDLGVRFYAAAPLVTPDGMAIGTLCVLDQRPRRLDADQRSALQSLASQAMAQVVLRQQMAVTTRLEERFRALVEQSFDLIALVDGDGDLQYISPAVRRVLGYEPDDPELQDLGAVIQDPAARATFLAARDAPPGTTVTPVQIPVRRKDGSVAHLEVRCSNLLHDPAVEAVVVNCRDVTEQRLVEESLERTQREALEVLETANDAYIQIDSEGAVVEWNQQATRAFGWSRDEVVGRPVSDLIIPARYHDAHLGGVARAASHTERPGRMIFRGLEVVALRRDGTEFPVEVTLWSTVTPDDDVRFSAFVRDITQRRTLEERLAHHALHDDLTGLPNRHLLRDRLESALARAEGSGRYVGVLFCDLDRFKVINDSSGHSTGDDVLRQVAARLEDTVRAADTVVRFGGDEFVIVVDGADDAIEVSVLAERIRRVLAEPLAVGDLEVPTSVSIGVTVGGSDASAERMVSDADAAMHVAKERGRNRIEVFDDALRIRVRARLDDERDLRRAIDEGELRVQYQPIVALDGGGIVGAEALVRWQRPGYGLLSPAAFVPLAEETGLIAPIGAWVLSEACRQLRIWQDTFPDRSLGVAVNASAYQVDAGDLGTLVFAELRRSGVEPRALTIELTESTLMKDLQKSTSTLTALQSGGIHIAIDDFGTGYSSLSYLKALPIDTLKVDRSFVTQLGIDPYDSAIVEAVTAIAHALGLRVVAEGVETAEQAIQVRAYGCDSAQGYHFARPMDPDAFTRFIREDRRW